MTFYSQSPVLFGSVSMVTGTLGANDPDLGTVVSIDEERYVFVYNAGGSQISVGQCATVSATTNYSVTVTTTANTDMIVGVCKHATLTTATYGWLLQKGFCPITASATVTIAPGDLVLPGSNGFFINTIVSAATSTPQSRVVGKCVATAASASTVGAAWISL